jgi:glycosyltransferase involved in cell wall biosynthesis
MPASLPQPARGFPPVLPTITVVTPSFNQAPFLRKTIESVLSQGYPRLEYIIIDGGSADDSKNIIEEHGASLSYWCSEPDRGQADALAKGFARATGDILCWLNSDDILLPGALLAVGKLFATHPEAEVLNGGGFVIDEDGEPLLDGFWTYSEGVAATYGRLKWYGQDGIFQPATFWRRTAYEAVGGINPDLYFLMDKDLFVRLAQRRRFVRVRRLLACFRLHASCKSRLHEERRLTEEVWFRARYSSHAGAALLRPAFYCVYRLQSLYRKARTAFPVKCGLRRLEVPEQVHR